MKDVLKCPECERITPKRHPKCVYCAATLRRSAVDDIFEPRSLGSDKKRFTRQSDERGHYLLVASGKPVELDPGPLFVMGRDPRTSLVVHAGDVSRQHAEISWDGDPPTPSINEVRSRNGTYLNDKLVRAGEPLPLRSGDEIRLGALVSMTYLYGTDRELRKELEEREKSDTDRFEQRGAKSVEAPPGEDLGELVAAALGEATLAPLEASGDFARVPGNDLVKRLYNEGKSGILTVYDGEAAGELILIDGRCQHAVIGMLRGKQALRHVASLAGGLYRFRPEDPDLLAESPPPAEVDENGLALTGAFRGSVLIRDLVARKETGVLTVFNGKQSGCLVLEGGICQTVQLGSLKDREALDALVRLDRGVYRFRPAEFTSTGNGYGGYDPPTEPDSLSGSMRRPPPSSERLRPPPPSSERLRRPPPSSPRSAPLRAPHSDEDVRRRASQPMRAPPPSDRLSRRQRPPLPKRRNPPPRPY